MKKLLNTLFIVDIGIIIFCFLSNNRSWLINSQMGFFSALLIVLASFYSYRNMVIQSTKDISAPLPNDPLDAIDTIEDSHDLYSNNIEATENQNDHTTNKRNIKDIAKDSKPFVSLYRLGAYGVFVSGFLYLNSTHMLELKSYLFGITMPIVISILVLYRQRQS